MSDIKTQAELAVRRAEAYQLGEARKREAEAKVLEVQNRAMAQAALAEAERVEAEERAKLEAPARASKARTVSCPNSSPRKIPPAYTAMSVSCVERRKRPSNSATARTFLRRPRTRTTSPRSRQRSAVASRITPPRSTETIRER